MTDLEPHAEAILGAAGSSLRHYTMPATRDAILTAVAAVHKAGREDADRELVEALEAIARNEAAVFDEDLECNVFVSMDAEEMADIASNALARVRGEA